MEISERWEVHHVFHVSLLEAYGASNRPNREQLLRDPEVIKGDLEWKVERFVKSEIISYMRKVHGRNKQMKGLRYFLKWKGCDEVENTWETTEAMKNRQEEVERFHRKSPEQVGPRGVE